MKVLIVFLALASFSSGEVSHILHPPALDHEAARMTRATQGPLNPYSFQYNAGRYPGQIDRHHSETDDGYGNVQGSYSYIDPQLKGRTVVYTVGANGYHPSLMNYDVQFKQQADSEAVRQETERHRILYNQIAARNLQGLPAQPTQFTDSGQRARDFQQYLYEKIALQHAAIGAERASQHY